MKQQFLLGALALAIAGCDSGQSRRRTETVPVEPLPIGADTVVVPWAELPEAGWLGGRRWVVVGADFDAAMLVDFATRQVRPIGAGRTPELTKPFGVFTVGDTAFIADWGRRRLTIWSPEGQLLDTVPAPAATRGMLPRGRDAAGQYYFEVPPVAGANGRGLLDSAVVVRSNPGLTVFDTVARLAPLDVVEISEARGKRFERLVFSGSDWWGVLPDGRLWVARVRRSEVSTIENRRERRGERLPDPVIEVTPPDREQYVATFPPELRSMAEQLPYAPFHAAFERGFGGADGLIWLRKARPALDSVRRYQVVDSAGRLARVFSTLGQGVIVAAGRDAVLFAEQFRDGVRLMEIRLPAPPPPAAEP